MLAVCCALTSCSLLSFSSLSLSPETVQKLLIKVTEVLHILLSTVLKVVTRPISLIFIVKPNTFAVSDLEDKVWLSLHPASLLMKDVSFCYELTASMNFAQSFSELDAGHLVISYHV